MGRDGVGRDWERHLNANAVAVCGRERGTKPQSRFVNAVAVFERCFGIDSARTRFRGRGLLRYPSVALGRSAPANISFRIVA